MRIVVRDESVGWGRVGVDVILLVIDGGIEALEDDQLGFDDSSAAIQARSVARLLLHFRQTQVE